MRTFILAPSLMLASACVPTFDERPWLIDAPRVLAIRAEPPEARPGETIALEALIASPPGAGEPAPSWAFCVRPRQLAERNTVAPECLADSEDVVPIPNPFSALVPMEACALFGPDTPPSMPGEPPLRSADPDPTGGYRQPIRVKSDDPTILAFGHERIHCSLAGAPLDILSDYQARYTFNQNPALASISASIGGGGEQELESLGTIAPGSQVSLRALWDPATAEPYVSYDIASVSLLDRKESIRVSWFATAGSLDSARTSVTEVESRAGTSEVRNVFTAPAEPQGVTLWVVIADSRGGASWREISLDVR
jgi:hypothetical protein